MQSGRRWLIYTGSPADTTLDGLTPLNTYYSTTIYTVPPEEVVAGNSVLYRTPNPSGGGGGGAGGIIAGGVAGAAAAGGSLAASLSPLLLAGLAPNSILAASPLYLAENAMITGAAAPIKGAEAPVYENAKKYKFYYDNESNSIIWLDGEETPSVTK